MGLTCLHGVFFHVLVGLLAAQWLPAVAVIHAASTEKNWLHILLAENQEVWRRLEPEQEAKFPRILLFA